MTSTNARVFVLNQNQAQKIISVLNDIGRSNQTNVPLQLTDSQASTIQEAIPGGTISISDIFGPSSDSSSQTDIPLFTIAKSSS